MTPNFFIVDVIVFKEVPKSLKKEFSFFIALKASISFGGFSFVVKTVYKILIKKTKAPIPNAIFTDSGNIPGAASSENPRLETNQGKLEATQVPIPIIKV